VLAAQSQPDKCRDMIVRIDGYSERFIRPFRLVVGSPRDDCRAIWTPTTSLIDLAIPSNVAKAVMTRLTQAGPGELVQRLSALTPPKQLRGFCRTRSYGNLL